MYNKLWNRYHTGKVPYVHKYGIREIICIVILEVLWERETVKGAYGNDRDWCSFTSSTLFFYALFFFKIKFLTDSQKKCPSLVAKEFHGRSGSIFDIQSLLLEQNQTAEGQKEKRAKGDGGASRSLHSFVSRVCTDIFAVWSEANFGYSRFHIFLHNEQWNGSSSNGASNTTHKPSFSTKKMIARLHRGQIIEELSHVKRDSLYVQIDTTYTARHETKRQNEKLLCFTEKNKKTFFFCSIWN